VYYGVPLHDFSCSGLLTFVLDDKKVSIRSSPDEYTMVFPTVGQALSSNLQLHASIA